MAEAANKLLEGALSLPSVERQRIAELLLDSVAMGSPDEIRSSWVAEAVRRGDALERGETQALDGLAALRGLKAKPSSAAP